MSSGCGDVLSLDDLKTAKLHQLFEAEVITGLSGGVAGGTPIDYATNPITMQIQKTLPAVLRDAGFTPAGFTFQTGGTLTATDRDKVVYDSVSMAWYSWRGALPKVVAAASNPLADSNWIPQTDPNLRTDLSSATIAAPGTGLIGTPLGTTLTNLLSVGRFVDPRMPPFNYRGTDDIATRTASLQAAFDYCNTNKTALLVPGVFFDVTKILLNGHTDYSIIGSGGFVTRVTGFNPGIEMKNCRNVNFASRLSLNYDSQIGIKIWGELSAGGTSLMTHRLSMIGNNSVSSYGCYCGDVSEPDALLSEIVFTDGYTFNCGEPFFIYGSQAVIEVTGYQFLAGGASTPAGPNGQVRAGTVVGGVLHVNGGEALKTSNTVGGMFYSYPIDSPSYDNAYGSVYINGAALECASPWFIAYNPNGVSSPAAGSGAFVVNSCHGFFGQDVINIQVTDAFTGQLRVKNSRFHRTAAKTTATVIASGGAYPVCDIDDSCFDNNFPRGMQKFTGTSVPLFSYRRLGQISNLNGMFIAGGGNQTVLKFTATSTDAINDNGFALNYYNASTGAFTIPKGGLQNATMYIQWQTGGTTSGSILYVMKAGTQPIAQMEGGGNRLAGTLHLGNLVEGDVITVVFQNVGSGFNALTQASDYIALSGSRT